MTVRHHAVCIDGTDWSDDVLEVDIEHSVTLGRRDGTSRPTPGRQTTSLAMTLRKTGDTQALVGTIPPDGHAEVLLILADDKQQRRAVVAHHIEATTLLPPWDTDVAVAGEDCFESSWYIARMMSCGYTFP